MKQFLSLLEKSVVVRGSLALLITIAWLILLLERQTTPAELWILLGMSWGYFFGSGAHRDAQAVLGKEKK